MGNIGVQLFQENGMGVLIAMNLSVYDFPEKMKACGSFRLPGQQVNDQFEFHGNPHG